MIHPYSTEMYARTLKNIGQALFVPHWRTSVLVRKINATCEDIIGVYPITVIAQDADLKGGLDYLKKAGFVSVILVFDHFNHPSVSKLQEAFEFFRPFKEHYIYRPQASPIKYSKHHRYEIRKALKTLHVEKINLGNEIHHWQELYSNLIKRHHLKSLHVFPPEHYQTLSHLEGIISFGAWMNNKLVSCHIWAEHNGFVHSHLAASNETGYETSAAYALNDLAITYFNEAKIINFGGGAGFTNDLNNGLVKFKRGFSNEQAMSYLGGAILNKDIYQKLLLEYGVNNTVTDFFPAYRLTKNGSIE